ncbi:hypothetical protein BDD12DRAFT_818837, partial [Trichophaea hybrida]
MCLLAQNSNLSNGNTVDMEVGGRYIETRRGKRRWLLGSLLGQTMTFTSSCELAGLLNGQGRGEINTSKHPTLAARALIFRLLILRFLSILVLSPRKV